MFTRRLLFAQLAIVFPLALTTWIAIAEALYWRIWWIDIPMHFFGGMWAGLCGAWLLARRGNRFSLLWCVLFALGIGIAWEIFEYSEGIAAPYYVDYSIDTAKDLTMDLIGAGIGWILAKRLVGERWMSENTI